MYIYINSRGDFSKFFSRWTKHFLDKGVGGKETNCKEVGRRGQDRSDILSRLAPAHGGITKLKFNYTAGRRTCAAERFPPRDFSLSLSSSLSLPKDIRENCVARSDDRRETSPLRNDGDNLPLSFVSFRREANSNSAANRQLPFLSFHAGSIRKILERSRKRFFRNGKTNEKTGRTEGEET